METPNDITIEEQFAYYVSSGKSKTEAYRLLFDCKELSDDAVRMRAWRYSNSPQVLHLLANEADNLYVKYNKARTQAFDVLLDLALNADSQKVQSDSANAILTQTAKLAKNIEVNVVNNEFNLALNELRQTLLTPHSFPSEGNNSLNNTNSNFEKLPSRTEELKKQGYKFMLGNEGLTLDKLNEQEFGINPLSCHKGDKGNRIQDLDTGKMVSYKVAREYLEQQDSDA